MQKEFWNNRYATGEYIFGREPNVFFKSVIDTLSPGKIFIPGAGEGRDAVYAAIKGWDVYCIDLSNVGRDKALKLANEKNVSISYEVKDIIDVDFAENHFDAIAGIFFHLPTNIRTVFHQNAGKWLKQGGQYFTEVYHPLQLNNTSGGPKEIDMLVTSQFLTSELKDLEIIKNSEEETILAEGIRHVGKANVVRFIGKKTSTI